MQALGTLLPARERKPPLTRPGSQTPTVQQWLSLLVYCTNGQYLRLHLVLDVDGGAVRLIHLVRVVNLQNQVRGLFRVNLKRHPFRHFSRRGPFGPREQDLFSILTGLMVSTIPRFCRSVVDADASTRLQDDVVGLVGIAVRSKLGDVDRSVAIVDEFYSGVNKNELSCNQKIVCN